DELPAEVGEPLRPERQLAENEQRPAIADDVQRTRHGAVLVVALHDRSLTVPFLNSMVPFMNSTAPTRGTHGERAVLLVTGLAVFAVFLDTTILFVAFSSIGQSFPDATTSELSWVLNAYTIVFAAFLVPAGVLADRIGRRRVFLAAVAAFT